MHVAILGLGPSVRQFLETTKRNGGRRAFCDEVWGINALGDVFACDRVFHMDDVRIQEIRAAARPKSNIAHMLRWLKTYRGEVITSRAHPDYPSLVEFPLEEVLTAFPTAYFNSTAAYAVAYAIHKGASKITCFGMDFTYPDAHHAEKGRACVEFWLGIAASRGIQLALPRTTTLMDSMCPQVERFYGYDCVELSFKREGELVKVGMKEIEKLPSADEIEARYDHNQHPNALMTDVGDELRSGERQVATSLTEIRRDHVARYEWATKQLPAGAAVIDFGCGIGYGSKILADSGHRVLALDRSSSALEFGLKHYDHDLIEWREDDAPLELPFPVDAAVCFEVIEHLADPRPVLKKLREAATVLLASVPNEEVYPFKGQAFHFRHYTRGQFSDLLAECGWLVESEWGQVDHQAEVTVNVGRTIVVVAKRKE